MSASLTGPEAPARTALWIGELFSHLTCKCPSSHQTNCIRPLGGHGKEACSRSGFLRGLVSRAELASESLSWVKLPFGVSAVAQAFYTQPLCPGVLRLLPSSVYLWIFFAASCWGAKLITQVTPPDRAESLGQKSSYGGLCRCPGGGTG